MTSPAATPTSTSTCPICGGTAAPYCAKHDYGHDWQIDRCGECGYGFVANRPTIAKLTQIYSKDESHLPYGQVTAATHAARADARNLASRAAALARGKGPSLDVGCGDGAFSFHLQAQGFGPPFMIDLDPRAQRTATALVPGAIFRMCTFEDFSDRAAAHMAEAGVSPASGKFAAIVMSQVLEHALDPLDWLRRAAMLLCDGGILAIAVPNFGGVYRILGARDPFIRPPIHLNYFTPKALRLAMARCGLRTMRLDSRSEISMSRRAGIKGLLVRMLVAAWNATSIVLNGSSRGVILRAFAMPANPTG
jgi:2-polyprenyl-3-methyl-5-hydroxy-6-metoxy-1,4-benzoquinol methylase